MKIKYWLIVVSLVCLQSCTAAIVSALTPNGGGSSGGLLNLFILNGLIRPSGGGTTAIATYDFTSGIPTGWTGTWTSTSSSCPATGTVPCLRSAVTANSQSSALSFTTTLKATKISFKRRVSSESGFDYCKFTIDGLNITGEGFGVSGTDDKLYEFVFSEAASRTFAWTYSKDSGGIGGFDLCSLDDVVLYGVSSDISGTDTTSGYSTSTAFSNLNNPNGVWSYGFKSTVTGTFTAYTKSFNYGTYNSWYNVFDNPSFMYNYSNSTVYGVAPKESSLHPGSSGEISVLRWTAPQAGTLSIKGSFKAGDTGAVDVYILKNTTTLFSKTSTLITESYDQTTTVAIGDTVDFQVGNAGNFTSDSTPIDGVITYTTAGTTTTTTLLGCSDPAKTNVTVSILAGSASASGYVDGIGTAARFSGVISASVLDSAGNLYVSDYNNYRVRKITATGVVTTLAGSGFFGDTNGTGTAASFSPGFLVIDSSGNLLMSDTSSNKIKKITQSGVVTTFAGSGTSASIDGTVVSASFLGTGGLAFDKSGNLYVGEAYKIRKISSIGVVTTVVGSTEGYLDGNGTNTKFKSIGAISFDNSGNLFVGDTGNQLVRKVTTSLDVTTAGIYQRLKYSQFNFDSSGNVFGSDFGAVYRISPTGISTVLATSAFDYGGVVLDNSGNLFVARGGIAGIQKITCQ